MAISHLTALSSLTLTGEVQSGEENFRHDDAKGVQPLSLPTSLVSLRARLFKGQLYLPDAIRSATHLRSLSLQLESYDIDGYSTARHVAIHASDLLPLAPSLTSLALASVSSGLLLMDAARLGLFTALRQLRLLGIDIYYDPSTDPEQWQDADDYWENCHGRGATGGGQGEGAGEEASQQQQGSGQEAETEDAAGPGFLTKLTQLTLLELDSCGAREVPGELSCLTKLKDLTLGGISGYDFEADEPVGIPSIAPLCSLPQLTRLSFKGCCFLTPPMELRHMTALQELRLLDCQGLGDAPEGLRLPRLQQERCKPTITDWKPLPGMVGEQCGAGPAASVIR